MTHHILVADDSGSIQKVIRIAFAKYAVKVETATHLTEALTAVRTHRPHAIIADVSLPGTQTPKDLKRIAQEAKQAPVILLRGSYDQIDEESLRREGLATVMRKPFEPRDIVRVVQEVLGCELGQRVPQPAAEPQFDLEAVALPPLTPDPPLMTDVDLEEEPYTPVPPPPTDDRRRGERAFGGSRSASSPLDSEGPTFERRVFPSAAPSEEALNQAKYKEMMVAMIHEELPRLVREAVEDYCNRHFNALARETITKEIKRLTEERTRHLVDN